MTDKDVIDSIISRVERIEDELGIEPHKEELERQAKRFAGHYSYYTFEGVTDRGAIVSVEGDLTPQMIHELESAFDSWEFQPDERRLLIRHYDLGI